MGACDFVAWHSRALAALGCDTGSAVVTAEDASGFAEAISALLQDADERDRMAGEGNRLVREHFSWTAVSVTLVALLQNEASGRR